MLNFAFTGIFLNKNLLPLFNKDFIDKQILPSLENLGDTVLPRVAPTGAGLGPPLPAPGPLLTPLTPAYPPPSPPGASFPGMHPCSRSGLELGPVSSPAVPVLKFLIILEHGAPVFLLSWAPQIL